MPSLTLNVNHQEQTTTVAQMRRQLARLLSKLDGGQPVRFSFTANLQEYKSNGKS